MGQVGVDMAHGLIEGLTDSEGAINQAMEKIGQSLVATAKSATGSHSPSTIFAGIGSDVMTGLQQGITSGTSGVVNALNQAGQAIVATGTTQVQKLTTALTADVNKAYNLNLNPSDATKDQITKAISDAQALKNAAANPNDPAAANMAKLAAENLQSIYAAQAASPAAQQAGGAPGGLNVYVTVQGQVVTQQGLVDSIWQGIVQKGAINGSAGQLL
jgi:hypothetical protein